MWGEREIESHFKISNMAHTPDIKAEGRSGRDSGSITRMTRLRLNLKHRGTRGGSKVEGGMSLEEDGRRGDTEQGEKGRTMTSGSGGV